MVSNRCKMAVKEELKKLQLHFMVVDLGEVEIKGLDINFNLIFFIYFV